MIPVDINVLMTGAGAPGAGMGPPGGRGRGRALPHLLATDLFLGLDPPGGSRLHVLRCCCIYAGKESLDQAVRGELFYLAALKLDHFLHSSG